MRRMLSIALVASLLAGVTVLQAFGQSATPTDTWTQVDVEDTPLQSASASRHYAGPIKTPTRTVSAAALTPPVMIFSNGFDTAPSPWMSGGWGSTTYRKTEGAYSAYCVGALVPAPGPYPNDVVTWLDVGPFDLSSFATAELFYDVWAALEANSDYLYVGVSTDYENWDMSAYSGSTAWRGKQRDLSAYCGQPRVWITFGFESDMDVQKEGVYIDDVMLNARRFTNVAPVPKDDTYYGHPNQPKVVTPPGVLLNDTDADHDTLQPAKTSDPAHGTVVFQNNGGFTYTPEPDFVGHDSFTYQVSDPYVVGSTLATVNIHIGENAPVAVDDRVMTYDGQQVVIVVTGNDIDLEGDILIAEKLSDPRYGLLTFNSTGVAVYSPIWTDAVEVTDSFTYRVFDGTAYSGIATVTIVTGPSKVPVFRFYNPSAGTHFYTASAEERDMVAYRWPNVYNYEGIAYYVSPYRNTQPLYRFYNKKNGSHFYTASADEANAILAKWPTIFTLDGQTYKVSPSQVPDSVMVLRLYNKQNGSHFYTASIEECNIILSKWWDTYSLDGPAFWLAQ